MTAGEAITELKKIIREKGSDPVEMLAKIKATLKEVPNINSYTLIASVWAEERDRATDPADIEVRFYSHCPRETAVKACEFLRSMGTEVSPPQQDQRRAPETPWDGHRCGAAHERGLT